MITIITAWASTFASALGLTPEALARTVGVIVAAVIAALMLLAAKRAYDANLRAEGVAACISKIDTMNREAANVAAQSRARVRACLDGGGVWNAIEGACQH